MTRDDAPTYLYSPQVRRWLPAVVLALAILYGLAVGGHWAIRPDSGLYLALGRSLAEGRGMDYNGRQMWGVTPLVPLLIAGCRWLAGPHAMWLINAAMSLFGVGTALAALGIANRLAFGETERVRIQLAVGTLLVVGASARLFGDATFVLTDVPFTFLFSLGLYFFLRAGGHGQLDEASGGHWAWCLAGGLALLAGAMTRPVIAVLAPAVLVAMALDPRREGYWRRLSATVVAVAIVAAGFLYWWFELRSWSDPASADYGKALAGGFLSSLLADRLPLMARGVVNIPQAIAGTLVDQKLPWANLVVTLAVLVGLVTALRRRQWLVVMPVVFYMGFLVVWGGGAMAARYMLPVMPLLAYCLLVGVRVGVRGLTQLARRSDAAERRAALGLAVAVGICLGISLPKDIRTIYWARHEKFYKHYAHGRWRGLVEVSQAVRKRSRRQTDVVATEGGAVVHYLTGLRVDALPFSKREYQGVYERPPKEVAELVAKGDFRFVIVPLDEPGRSRATLEEIAKTGAFRPAQRYRDMALFERW